MHGDGAEQFHISLRKYPAYDAVVDVNDAESLLLGFKRYTQNGVQALQYHALAGAEALILLGVAGQDRLALPSDLFDHAA